MNGDDYRALVDHGIIGKIELLPPRAGEEPVVTCGNFRLAFDTDQVRAAADLGIDLTRHQPG